MSGFPFEKLREWRKSIELVRSVYKFSRNLPSDEKSGLIGSLRKSATTVATKIADGHGRDNSEAFGKAVTEALGSLRELQTHIILAERLNYVTRMQTSSLRWRITRVRKMLERLSASLAESSAPLVLRREEMPWRQAG